jgi:cytoskeletal protein CcmA (bactofilin family)
MLIFKNRYNCRKSNVKAIPKVGGKTIETEPATEEIFIPRDTRITGSFETKHKVRLEGHVYGPLTACQVLVGSEATVEGEVNATDVFVRGRIKGSLRAKHVYLYASGEVDGDMVVSSIVIEEGTRCVGNIKQEKYGVAKPIIKWVVAIDDDFAQASREGDLRFHAIFVEMADKMGPGATFRDVAEELMR